MAKKTKGKVRFVCNYLEGSQMGGRENYDLHLISAIFKT